VPAISVRPSAGLVEEAMLLELAHNYHGEAKNIIGLSNRRRQ
jgi:hypothetical protein